MLFLLLFGNSNDRPFWFSHAFTSFCCFSFSQFINTIFICNPNLLVIWKRFNSSLIKLTLEFGWDVPCKKISFVKLSIILRDLSISVQLSFFGVKFVNSRNSILIIYQSNFFLHILSFNTKVVKNTSNCTVSPLKCLAFSFVVKFVNHLLSTISSSISILSTDI